MNVALWKKSWNESRWLLAGCMLIMFVAHWLRVWLSSYLPSQDLASILSFLPEFIEPLLPVSYKQIATPAGKIAAAYDDPIVLLLVTVWAISRGSDAVLPKASPIRTTTLSPARTWARPRRACCSWLA